MIIAPSPKAMNINPAKKSFGWRIFAMTAPPLADYLGLLIGLPGAGSDPRRLAWLVAVLGAQILQILVDDLRLHALLELRFDLVVARDLRIADVIDFDDVPAELRLHRRGRELALRGGNHRIGERLDEVRRRVPVEIAPVGLRASVLGALGELLEL